MANYSRYLLRMLPVRRWPRTGFGSAWPSAVQPSERLLWPSGGRHSFVDEMMADMEHQFHEMEKLSRALFQATPPLLAWERVDRPPRQVDREGGEAGAVEKAEGYRFAVDVAGFAPEEMAVKLDGRRVTLVARRHKESHGEDAGYWEEQKELRREILLPDDVDLDGVTCSLASDGQLCIEAPRLAMATGKTIPIDVKPAGPEASGGEDQQEKPKDS